MPGKPAITRDILIEDLINNYSFSVRYLMDKGIRCIMCGEPIWGTLEEAAKEKNFSDASIADFISEMTEIANGEKLSAPGDQKLGPKK